MKKIIVILVGGLLGIVLIFAGVVQLNFEKQKDKTYSAVDFSIKELVEKADVQLGKRLFAVRNGCIDCHGSDLSGVMVMDDPAMGSIYGANITSTYLSEWSDEEVARAIRYGIHKTGRSLRFMPSFDFANLSLDDTAALVAYVRSVSPVEKPSHKNTFGPIAKVLTLFNQMPVMFPAKVVDLNRGFGEKPTEAPTREFGQYLANSCTGCHGEEFRGGKILGGDPAWPEAANIRLGNNSVWTEKSFSETIVTGISASSHKKLRPPMPIHLLAQMNETEVKALWSFLSSLN